MELPANLRRLSDQFPAVQPRHVVLCQHKREGEYALYLVVPTPAGDIGCCPSCAYDTFARMHEWLECEGCGFRIHHGHFRQAMGGGAEVGKLEHWMRLEWQYPQSQGAMTMQEEPEVPEEPVVPEEDPAEEAPEEDGDAEPA